MAFSDFIYPEALQQLGLRVANSLDMFARVADLPATPVLRGALAINIPLATTANTEAARAAWMVAPILSDLWGRYQGQINLHSGLQFAADPEAGLIGYCDFLIGRAPQQPQIVAPVVVIFEAKSNAVIDGFGQCIAGMVGAQRFNRRAGNGIEAIYGVSTTGTQWRFLRLNDSLLTIDLVEYTMSHVDRLLGILAHVVGPVPGAAAA